MPGKSGPEVGGWWGSAPADCRVRCPLAGLGYRQAPGFSQLAPTVSGMAHAPTPRYRPTNGAPVTGARKGPARNTHGVAGGSAAGMAQRGGGDTWALGARGERITGDALNVLTAADPDLHV